MPVNTSVFPGSLSFPDSDWPYGIQQLLVRPLASAVRLLKFTCLIALRARTQGRQFPVQVFYTALPEESYLDAALATVMQVSAPSLTVLRSLAPVPLSLVICDALAHPTPVSTLYIAIMHLHLSLACLETWAPPGPVRTSPSERVRESVNNALMSRLPSDPEL